MNRFLLPVSVVGTVIGGTVLLKDYVAGGACPSKATIPGKTVIVTGANTGIGKQTALELAKRGGNVILACRDMEKCEAAARDIRGETLNPHVRAQHLDLASLKSIREFARKIIKEEERVDVLVNNAAVMRCPHWTTEDGFEMQFGVNHLGHFLLTNLLLDKLKASAPSRIINLSSLAHVAGHIDFDDLNWKTKKYDTKAAYCQSKLAVVLFTKELSRRLQGTGVTVNALHPGVARTELGRHTDMHNSAFSSFTLGPFFWLLFKSPQLAAQPSTYLAVAEELESVSGKYFDGLREKAPSPEAEDEEVAGDFGLKVLTWWAWTWLMGPLEGSIPFPDNLQRSVLPRPLAAMPSSSGAPMALLLSRPWLLAAMHPSSSRGSVGTVKKHGY